MAAKDKSSERAERKRQERKRPDAETRRFFNVKNNAVVRSDDSKTDAPKRGSGYVKLKNPAREADRRSFVRAELERKGIQMNPEGKRSVSEIAAREMARQKWAKQKKRARRNASSPSGDYGQSWMME